MLRVLIGYRVPNLLHTLVESLVGEITAYDVSEVSVSFYNFGRSEMFQLDIFNL